MLFPSLSRCADAGCCACSLGGGERQCTRSSRAAGSLGPIAALPPHARKGNWRGARVDEILGGSGGWRRNSGARACSAHTQTGRNLFSPGPAMRGTNPDARLPCPPILLTGSPDPQGAGGPGNCARRGGAGAHSIAPSSIALPLSRQPSAGFRSGRESHGHARMRG